MTYNPIQVGQKTMANSSPVVIASDQSAVPVSGTFWQATQPVSIAATVAISAASLPLPTGAATAAKQPALGTAGTASSDVITVQGIASMTALKVDGSAVTQPISAASLPLPTGAATSAKQPALGTAGTASSDVITVQGIASMTALKVDNSAVTQPVSGTVTASNTTGNVAHDSADSGNPVKIGGKARQTNPTAVADGDRVDASFDDVGRQVVVLNQPRDLVGIQQTTITSSTTETTIVSAVASTFCDLVQLTITNSSATALIVTLKDSTAGTTRGIYALAANGGINISFPTPLPQAAVNNNWTLTCGTSVASIYVVAQYVKNV